MPDLRRVSSDARSVGISHFLTKSIRLLRKVRPSARREHPVVLSCRLSGFCLTPVGFLTFLLITMLSTQKVTMSKRTAAAALSLIAATLGLAACGSSSGGAKHLTLVAYSTPQGVFEKLIPAFEETPDGAKRTYVSLARRAIPLIELLEWSLKKQVPVVWGV